MVNPFKTGVGQKLRLPQPTRIPKGPPPQPGPPPPPTQRIWAESFLADVYVRIEGGYIEDQSPRGTEVTPIGGTTQIVEDGGLNGFPGLKMSPTTGYVSFPVPSNLNGADATMTVEARFKPADYANWVICGPSATENVLAIVCTANVLYVGLGPDPISTNWISIDLTSLDPVIISPDVLGAEGFWHIELSAFFTGIGAARTTIVKLNGYPITGSASYPSYQEGVDASGTMVLGSITNGPQFVSDVMFDEFRIRIGHFQYGSNYATSTWFNKYVLNPVRFTNSTGQGLGWDIDDSGRYNNSPTTPPLLEFLDNNRTVNVDHDPTTPNNMNVGSLGFAETKRIEGNLRYFEIVVNKWSTQTVIGIMALPLNVPTNQLAPYSSDSFYLLEVFDGGAGTCGMYTDGSDPSPVADDFFITAVGSTVIDATAANDTFGFFVNLTAGRVDKVVRNGNIVDHAPNSGVRLNTKNWPVGYKVIPYYTARPGPQGFSALLITAGEFRFPPQGDDAAYLPWDPAPPLPDPQVSALGIAKDQEFPTRIVNSTQTYVIACTNAGPDAADGATVVDALAAGSTFISCAITYAGGAAGQSSANALALAAGVVIPTFPVGGQVFFTIAVTLTSAGNIDNTAVIQVPLGNGGTGGQSTVTTVVTIPGPPTNLASILAIYENPPPPGSGAPLQSENGSNRITEDNQQRVTE